MKKETTVGLSVLGALGAVGAAAYWQRQRLWQQLLKLPPAQNKVSKQSNVRVMMPDGISLATDVYRPLADGRYPTILVRTPYGRSNPLSSISVQRMAERGYVVVSQDCRGTADSEGEFEPYVHEASDGQATIEWIAKQPWSDGQVGMWGQSYVGFVQWAAAATGVSALKAIVPCETMAYLGHIPEEGYNLDRVLRWLYILDALQNEERPRWQSLLRLLNNNQQDQVVAQGYDHLPLSTVDEAFLGRAVPFYRSWQDHSDLDDVYWQKADYRPQVPEIAIPTHLIAGWYDIFTSGQFADYEAMRAAGLTPYLTVGPWTHLDFAVQWQALRLALDWFDGQLKGQRQKLRAKPVRLYVMGAEEWREYESWPPPAEPAPYYLHGNGRLSPLPAPPDNTPDHYRYDPAEPTPNVGGALLSVHAGPQDNRELEARADVLTYTTQPLRDAVTIIGSVQLILFVQSSQTYTDFFGRLCDVHPDGRSINICDGLFRVEPGKGEEQADGTLCLAFTLSPTAYQFQPGHAIRLQVSSGAHPRIARNLGTGDAFLEGVEMVTADQTIYHSTDRPSALLLPIVSDR